MNWNFLFDYFMPGRTLGKIQNFEDIQFYSKAQLGIRISLITAFIVFFFFIFRLINFENDNWTVYLLPGSCLMVLGSLFLFKRTGNLNDLNFILIVLSLTVLPIRTYFTGGLSSPNMSWYPTMIIYIAIIKGFRTSIFTSLYFFLVLIIISQLEVPIFYSSEISRLIILSTSVLIAILSLRSLHMVQSFVVEESKKAQHAISVNGMVDKLSHEINNPLTIAIGNLDVSQIENDRVEKIRQALRRIKDVVAQIQNITK